MDLNFYLAFSSQYGETIAIRINSASAKGGLNTLEFPLKHLNESYWHTSINLISEGIKDDFSYSYLYRNQHGEEKEFCKQSKVSLKKLKVKSVDIVDEWKDIPAYDEVFGSKPFTGVFKELNKKGKVAGVKNPTHIFKVKAPALGLNKVICITGSAKALLEWDAKQPLQMDKQNNIWHLSVNLSDEVFPVEYKIAVYDVRLQQMEYEEGNNRLLPAANDVKNLTVLHHTINTAKHQWKGAGINIPVSALRTEKSWGVGDFSDLNLLTDLSKATGVKLIQLLPINDTTVTNTNKDSYPYSAVSAFALHPIYLDVQKLAKASGVKFSAGMLQQVKELNENNSLCYQEVKAIKKKAIKLLFNKDKKLFKDDFGWFDFFDLNRHWLVPYAVFCYLRDKHKTADYNTWEDYKNYNEEQVHELASPENSFYDEIAIHYFTQYHLHLQLKDAVDYAHKCGVIIKGDLPIGVGRHSADAWMYHSLFHMDMQAGAPPDAFATKGQNWSFPTYNWEKMAADDFAWWRQRMEHMGNYFDAIRIDHVLGFFRIWSIPLHAVEGILGRFVPARPLSTEEFIKAGIHFNEDRFSNPYITEQLLHQLFAENAGKVKETFLHNYQFKEAYNTQRKIAAYIIKHPVDTHLQQGLFDLLANVIAFKDDEMPGHYHLRISMHATGSYKSLAQKEQQSLNHLYDEYFFNRQNDLWEVEGIKKLAALKRSTNMLICAEDLGMVPQMVEAVLANMEMLALEVQRMPKRAGEAFSNPGYSPYLSVVTPSTHDMAAIREWWEEDRKTIQQFFNQQLGQAGAATISAEPWVCKEVLQQHLNSPAMWAVFLMQDLLSMDNTLRIENPTQERINNPANPDHFWNYRMNIKMEFLLKQKGFIKQLKTMVQESGR